MIFLYATAFGQTNESEFDKIKKDTLTTKSYLGLVLNLVTTNLNYGNANGTLTDNKKSILGGQLGLSFQAGITPRFSMVSEFYFIMKGGSLEADNSSSIKNTTLRLYTFELPVLARYQVGKFYMNAGPSIAYNFYGTRKTEEVSSDLSFKNSSDGFKRWDAGVQVGAGYRFKIKQKHVALDVRYSYGLTNISYDKEIYNRYLNINLTFTKIWKSNPLGNKSRS